MNTSKFYWKGKPIRYNVQGDGACVLLLHGFAESAFIWDRSIAQLNVHYRLVSLDLPGFGESPVQQSIQSLEDLAKMILTLLDELKVDRFVAIGHSMGAYLALEILAVAKDRLLGLGLVNSHVFGDDPDKRDLRMRSIKLMEKAGSERFVEEMYNGLFTEQYKRENGMEFEGLLQRAKQIPTSVLIQYYRLMMERKARSLEFGAYSRPVLVLCGRNDPLIPKESALKQSYLSQHTHFEWVNNCSHMAMFEQPEVLQKSLERYLTALCGN